MAKFTADKFDAVSLDFTVWDYTIPEIYGIILGMFSKLGLVECLNITEGELLDFIIDVDRGYLEIFYHSFYHAADVTSVLYHMLIEMNASHYLSKPDMAALLLAGLCHDIGHVSKWCLSALQCCDASPVARCWKQLKKKKREIESPARARV